MTASNRGRIMAEFINELERLRALHESGHLTNRQFEAAKDNLLDRSAVPEMKAAGSATAAVELENNQATNESASIWVNHDQPGIATKIIVWTIAIFVGIGIFSYLHSRGTILNMLSGSSAASAPASMPDDQASQPYVKPGEYSYFSDGSGGSTKNQLAQLCTRATLVEKQMGVTLPLTGWIAEGGPLGRLSQNGGASLGQLAVDSEGVCRQDVSISGVDNGNSYNFSGRCRVTSIVVDDDQKVGVRSIDKYDCQ